MSALTVEVVQVDQVTPHPNADRLEIATVKGWQCVVGKGEFQAGDKGFYFPIDSVLPQAVRDYLFADTKVTPPTRIKTMAIRGAVSQGLLVSRCLDPKDAYKWEHVASLWEVGEDFTEAFGVTKYEPPRQDLPTGMRTAPARVAHPDFPRFTDVENWRNYPTLFQPDDWVLVTEKIHGTNFRCGWVPYDANTLWKRLMKFFRLTPLYEFVFGSRNVQLDEAGVRTVYHEIVEKYDLRNRLVDGEVLYGEIYGDGIQKGYSYGCAPGERRLAAVDMTRQGEWLHGLELRSTLERREIPMVPVLYWGQYSGVAIGLALGASSLDPSGTPIKEGVVIRSIDGNERYPLLGRKILKLISNDYLLRDQSDWH